SGTRLATSKPEARSNLLSRNDAIAATLGAIFCIAADQAAAGWSIVVLDIVSLAHSSHDRPRRSFPYRSEAHCHIRSSADRDCDAVVAGEPARGASCRLPRLPPRSGSRRLSLSRPWRGHGRAERSDGAAARGRRARRVPVSLERRPAGGPSTALYADGYDYRADHPRGSHHRSFVAPALRRSARGI